MNFELEEDHKAIVEGVRELTADFDDDYWRTKDRNKEFPWEFYNAFVAAGWLSIAIPEEYGGGGKGITEASLVLEEIAASGAGMNGCSSVHLTIFGLNPVVKRGSDRLRSEILPRVASGELHVAFGVTEPDAGTDTTQIRTFARREGDHFIVSGRKVWTSKAQECNSILLLTRTKRIEDCEKRSDGMTLFIADLDRDYCHISPIEKMGRNAVDSNEVFIDELPIPVDRVVGEVDQGFRCLLDGLNPERILVARESIGLGRAALEKAVKYANERVVFGRPIGKNQAIQFPLAECMARLDAAALVCHKAAWLYDSGQPCAREANEAKFLAADACYRSADQAVQTFGGFGYASEFHVERYFREARLQRLAPISQELALSYLGEHVLGLPRSF